MDHVESTASNPVAAYFAQGELRRILKGELLSRANEAATHISYVVSGYVKIYSTNSRGEQYLHILYGPGDVYPLIWLANVAGQNVSIEALTAGQVYSLPIEQVLADARADSELSFNLMRQAIEQYRLYTLRVDNLEYKYASERVVYRLLVLANRFGKQSSRGVTIQPPITHQLLGSSINLSRESVSREMEKLARRGYVHYNPGRQIILTDPAALAAQFKVPLHAGLHTNHNQESFPSA